MLKTRINCLSACLFFIMPALLSSQIKSTFSFTEKTIENKKMVVNADISGVTQAYDEYDVKADFDGKIIQIYPSLFDVVKSSDVIIRMVTGEVAALLKTAKDEKEKDYILSRWKGMFNYTDIKTNFDGIITAVYVKPDDFVKSGDRILRIARKMRVIAKNKNKMMMPPEKGLNGIIDKKGYGRYRITLTNFIPDNKKYYYKLLFDFDDIPDIKVGERVDGIMMIANRESTRVVPSSDVIEYNGKKYLIIQFEPGLITETETEVLSFTLNYISQTEGSVPAKKNTLKK